jgi:hypothetical protein
MTQESADGTVGCAFGGPSVDTERSAALPQPSAAESVRVTDLLSDPMAQLRSGYLRMRSRAGAGLGFCWWGRGVSRYAST